LPPVSAEFLIGLLFGLEDGDDMFLRNVVLSLNYTSFQPLIYKKDAPMHSTSNAILAKLFRKSKEANILELKYPEITLHYVNAEISTVVESV
jgi:hypothetical protein